VNESIRHRTIRVDRDVLERELRNRAQLPCVYVQADGSGDDCTETNWYCEEGTTKESQFCARCFARWLLALAETEIS